MAQRAYINFDLQIEPAGDGHYRSQVLESPSGQAESQFDLPFSSLQLENFYLRMNQPRQGTRDAGGELDPVKVDRTRELGRGLFDSLFGPDVYACYRSGLNDARDQGKGLRIRLRLKAPELATLPWEFLYDPHVNMFLSRSIETPIVRYTELPYKDPLLLVQPPLTMLVLIANPRGDLDVEKEWRLLDQALKPLQESRLLRVERLPGGDLGSLQRRLRQGDVHIFHFIGHGDYNEREQSGGLLFENPGGPPVMLNGDQLGPVLHNHAALRLVVLNACEGASASPTDPFSGLAQRLVQMGIPAVVAMQFPVSDRSAITFAEQFYGALADGFPVDAALVEARTAIAAQPNDVEWGTPVLFTRAGDGRIFDIQEAGRGAHPPDTPPNLAGGPGLPGWPIGLLVGLAGMVVLGLGWLLLRAINRPGPVATATTAVYASPSPQGSPPVVVSPTPLVVVNPVSTPPPAYPPADTSYPAPVSSPAETVTPGPSPVPPSPTPVRPMARLEAGVFFMGEDAEMAQGICFSQGFTTKTVEVFSKEAPRHDVYLDAYALDLYEVSVDQYAAFLNTLRARNTSYADYIDREWLVKEKILVTQAGNWAAGETYSGLPMVGVTWYGADAYCGAQGGHLPTEAQWERAARGQDGRIYAWGSEFSARQANFCDKRCGASYASGLDDGVGFLAPVNAFLDGQTPEGIFNLTGNVWEWVADRFKAYDPGPQGRPLQNPSGPATGNRRVIKGGAWNSTICDLRASTRESYAPSFSSNAIGFRCAYP